MQTMHKNICADGFCPVCSVWLCVRQYRILTQPSLMAGFYPEGTALQLVLKIIETTRQEIRLMDYSFTSSEVDR